MSVRTVRTELGKKKAFKYVAPGALTVPQRDTKLPELIAVKEFWSILDHRGNKALFALKTRPEIVHMTVHLMHQSNCLYFLLISLH